MNTPPVVKQDAQEIGICHTEHSNPVPKAGGGGELSKGAQTFSEYASLLATLREVEPTPIRGGRKPDAEGGGRGGQFRKFCELIEICDRRTLESIGGILRTGPRRGGESCEAIGGGEKGKSRAILPTGRFS